VAGLLLVIIGWCSCVWFIFSYSAFPRLLKPHTPQPTEIYTADGLILTRYTKDAGAVLLLGEMADKLPLALSAAQDPEYFRTTRTLPGITRQLARRLHENKHGRSASWWRKLRIAGTTWWLESRLSRMEIAAAYLNHSEFGVGSRGIEQASLNYFAKNARDLNPAECATLTGMLKAPTAYHPRRNPTNAIKRRNQVLGIMRDNGWLSEKECKRWQTWPLELKRPTPAQTQSDTLAPYFRDYVRKWFADWCEEHDYDPYTDGLKVYTTLNARLQSHAEAGMARHLANHQRQFDQFIAGSPPWKKDSSMLYRAFKASERYKLLKEQGWNERQIRQHFDRPVEMKLFSWQPHPAKPGAWKTGTKTERLSPWDSLQYTIKLLQSGLISIEPSTGKVRAYIGGIDYRYFKFDHVTQARRQVGSTFKPFVYATALEQGMPVCKKYLNQPITIIAPDGDAWTPRNADHDYCGEVSLRYGLVYSINVVTARLIQDVGPENVLQTVRKMGITSPLKPVPSMGLGTFDLSVAELTSAFTTFPNQGQHPELTFIDRIEDRFGNTIATFGNTSTRVLSPQNAYTIVQLLRGVATYGTAHEARTNYGLPWTLDLGGKTGTTQNSSDGWYVGFTPDLVTGIWVGCDERALNFGYSDLGRGSNMGLPIWGHYMRETYLDPVLSYDYKRKLLPPPGYSVSIECGDPPRIVKKDSTAADSLTLPIDSLNVLLVPPSDSTATLLVPATVAPTPRPTVPPEVVLPEPAAPEPPKRNRRNKPKPATDTSRTNP
jgi:penicillin-binding protein 1A